METPSRAEWGSDAMQSAREAAPQVGRIPCREPANYVLMPIAMDWMLPVRNGTCYAYD